MAPDPGVEGTRPHIWQQQSMMADLMDVMSETGTPGGSIGRCGGSIHAFADDHGEDRDRRDELREAIGWME